MLADLVLVACASNVVGDIGPAAEAVHFGALQEEEFFIGPPVFGEYRVRVLFDYLVRVSGAFVGAGFGARGEAGDAEVVFVAGGVSAVYPYL